MQKYGKRPAAPWRLEKQKPADPDRPLKLHVFPLFWVVASSLFAGCSGITQQDEASRQESLPFPTVPTDRPSVFTTKPAGAASAQNTLIGGRRKSADQGTQAAIRRFLPQSVKDANGWVEDIAVAFDALKLPPSDQNVCAVLAVTEQESTFHADPPVAGLSRIVRSEIDQRASKYGIPRLAVKLALAVKSPGGRTYADRIDTLRTENDLNTLYADMTSELPLGKTLLESYNPVRTGGPMQVSLKFAEAQVKDKTYPYAIQSSLRDELFSRRGGLYFGIAYLLDYPASYDKMIYRFADYNAGHYASRNAAFQAAINQLTGMAIESDGDLLRYTEGEISSSQSQTQKAVLSLRERLDLSEQAIIRDLRKEKTASFEKSPLFIQVFALARVSGGRLPRAQLPEIQLNSPKISHGLTTSKFARRVDERYRACLKRG